MSIISEQEFLSQLYIIQSDNPPSQVPFYGVKTIYDIDLNTREINAPKFLSISKDHQSETIYFRIDRYHDFMDLSLLTCVIQYITPDKAMHWYAVPFCDVITEKSEVREESKMIIPWCIDGIVTQYAGPITFSLRFFLVEQEIVPVIDYIDEESIPEGTIPTEVRYKMVYNLTTLPAKSEILEGMEVDELTSNFDVSAEAAAYLMQEINKINKADGVDWIMADSNNTITFTYVDTSGNPIHSSRSETGIYSGTIREFSIEDENALAVNGYTISSVRPTKVVIDKDTTITYIYTVNE